MGGSGSKCIGERDDDITNRQNGYPNVDKVAHSVELGGGANYNMNNFDCNGGLSVGTVNSTNCVQNATLDREKSPMPESTELERRFTKVLVSCLI